MRFLNAAQHDGLMHVIVLESSDKLIELADLNPVDAVDVICQLRIRFPLMSDSRNVIAQLPGIIGEDNRKPAIPGDQSQPFTAANLRYLRHGPIPRLPR